ncbi:MAG: chitobiase/beta-hexosaminidase C-terminal domain-containing protein [Candidatus Latescibacterota bacterium]|nr:chitobiase/beta-hexosaminidase C-terminal domain-containing protein [Candidatus Latescibacterota bacterium]
MRLIRVRYPTALLMLALMNAVDAPVLALDAVAGRSFYTDESVGRLVLSGLPADSLDSGSQWRAEVSRHGQSLVAALVQQGRRPYVEFPLSSLPQGESEVSCRVLGDDGVPRQASALITRLPHRAHAVKIDRLHGGLIVDDLPFFPFGFYCYSPVQPTLAEEEVVRGFNLMSPYQDNDPATRSERRAYMDRAAELGLKVHYQLLRVGGGGGVGGSAADQEGALETWLRAEVRAFRDHPALLAWYISDEPTGHGSTPAELERVYHTVRETDPYHPVTIVFVNPGKAANFASAMDLAMTDPYPIPNGPPASVRAAVRTAADDVSPAIPVWIVPQAFGGNEWWSREPTAAELRVMTWLGILEEATGVQYFIRHGLSGFPKSPVTWSAASQTALEVAALTPVLLSTEARPSVMATDELIQVGAWQHRGEIVVVAVNTSNEPRELELKLPDLEFSGVADVLYENRSVEVALTPFSFGPVGMLFRPLRMVGGMLRADVENARSSRIGESIGPYGVRIYRLAVAPGPEGGRETEPRNLIIDPSFEWDVTASVPAALYAGVGAGRGATYFVDGRRAFHGRRSVRLHTPRAMEGVALSPFAPAVLPGRSYRLSIWARAKKGEHPTLTLSSSSFAEDVANSAAFVLDDRWTRYDHSGVIDSGVSRAGLSVALSSPGTAWIDLLQFSDISPTISANTTDAGQFLVIIDSFVGDAELRYEVDGTEVTQESPLYTGPVALDGTTRVRAALLQGAAVISRADLQLHDHAGVGRFVDLDFPYSDRYPAGGPEALTDGVLGTSNFLDGRWQGFEGVDLEAVIDLGSAINVESVSARFLQNQGSWIWLPRHFEVSSSMEGSEFIALGRAAHAVDERQGGAVIEELVVRGSRRLARYIRVRAEGVKQCPAWHGGSGGPAWIFVDELRVNPADGA